MVEDSKDAFEEGVFVGGETEGVDGYGGGGAGDG